MSDILTTFISNIHRKCFYKVLWKMYIKLHPKLKRKKSFWKIGRGGLGVERLLHKRHDTAPAVWFSLKVYLYMDKFINVKIDNSSPAILWPKEYSWYPATVCSTSWNCQGYKPLIRVRGRHPHRSMTLIQGVKRRTHKKGKMTEKINKSFWIIKNLRTQMEK